MVVLVVDQTVVSVFEDLGLAFEEIDWREA
jgi:hypothetical protein